MTDAMPRFTDANALAAQLRDGQVAAIPTDTLPGLACRP
jgi:tRNA A37 threonylcarbamoyladenosine synthetase subunit TsaC/SUA5/YrdC